jgi:hypothetical protein
MSRTDIVNEGKKIPLDIMKARAELGPDWRRKVRRIVRLQSAKARRTAPPLPCFKTGGQIRREERAAREHAD